jgi:orotidine-5'-phosphate decarboxylase
MGMTADPQHAPKSIPARERLIVALDVPTPEAARALVERLGEQAWFYKLGLELFMSGDLWDLVGWLRDRKKRVFVDLKFFDVPETVRRSVRGLAGRGIDFATVHGNDAMLEAAVSAKGDTRILAVTVLTSLDRHDLDALGFACEPEALVLSRAERALALGCDGVVSSGLEAPKLRAKLGDRFLIVTPGIRPVENREMDDQKRTVDVDRAFANGADHIVVGRPIRDAPDPAAAAAAIQERIAARFPPG